MLEMSPSISVIIPVYNDTERLKQCLSALEYQSFPKENFEVIVVNNNPLEDLKPFLFPTQLNLVYLEESKAGSYPARNLALNHARADIVAFTDSDCIPSTGWLSSGLDCLKSEANVGIVAGEISLFYKNKTLSITEIYEKYTAFNQKESAKLGFNTTANWFSYKSVIFGAGKFEEHLKSNGDSILSHKIFKSGYQVKYCPEAEILHPARYRFQEIVNKRKRIIGGRYDYLKSKNSALFTGMLKACLSFLRSNLKKSANIFSVNKMEGLKYLLVVVVLFFSILFESLLLLLGSKSRR